MSKEIIPSPGGSNKFSRLISKIKAALGIVEESNTATHSIAAGKYVTWKGDLYKAKSAISSGATLSSSNLQTVPDGGLNELSEQIGTLNNKFAYHETFNITGNSKIEWTDAYIRKVGRFAELYMKGNALEAIPAWEVLTALPSTPAAKWLPFESNNAYTINISNEVKVCNINSTLAINTPAPISANGTIRLHAVYLTREL